MQEYNESAILKGQKEYDLKDDVVLIQFKLVENQQYKTLNTFSFINLPLKKIQDNNVKTTFDVIYKLKQNYLQSLL